MLRQVFENSVPVETRVLFLLFIRVSVPVSVRCLILDPFLLHFGESFGGLWASRVALWDPFGTTGEGKNLTCFGV